jgi:hypothetical protein
MNYFYMDDQSREIGPVSAENLKSLRVAGVIKDHTLVRLESGGPWTTCVSVVGVVGASSGAKIQAEATKVMSDTVADAKSALGLLNLNPVGGLAPAYQKLGAQRAGAVGIFFLIVYVVAGAYVINRLSGAIASLASFNFGNGLGTMSLNTGNWTKYMFVAGASAAALFAALALVRVIFQRGGRWEGDAFIAGAVSIVWAIALLIESFLGLKNMEVMALVALFAICITVMQLFVGLTRISELNEPRATVAVPVVIIVEVWLTKIIFTAICG